MGATTRSFKVTEEATEVINSRADGSGSYSVALNAALTRHAHIMAAEVPKLTEDEWLILIDVVSPKIEPWAIDLIEHQIKSAMEKGDPAGRVRIDPGQFAAKIKRMSTVTKFALVDAVERYRAAIGRGEKQFKKPWEV